MCTPLGTGGVIVACERTDGSVRSWARRRGRLVYSRREQEILEGAQVVFSERGFHGADVEEIARRVGVGKGTIYRHFGKKESLFLHLVRWGLQGLLRDLRGQEEAESDPLRRVQAFIQGYLQFFDQNREFFQILVHEAPRFQAERREGCRALRQAVIEHLARVLEEASECGLAWRVVPKLGATALLGMLDSAIFSGIQAEQPELTALGEAVEELFLHGALLEVHRDAPAVRG